MLENRKRLILTNSGGGISMNVEAKGSILWARKTQNGGHPMGRRAMTRA